MPAAHRYLPFSRLVLGIASAGVLVSNSPFPSRGFEAALIHPCYNLLNSKTG
jgi:hypothetical protein